MAQLVMNKYLDDDDIHDSNDSNDVQFESSDEDEDVGHIMSFLPKDDLDPDEEDEDDENDELDNIIEEEEEEDEPDEPQSHKEEEKEIVSQKQTSNIWNNNIISINLDALSQSLNHIFVHKTEFDEYNTRQCEFNEQIKSEQSQSLKDVLETNTEISEMNNEWKAETDKIRNEMNCLLDTELTKYELWIKSLMTHFETMINENTNEMESFKVRQNKISDKLKKYEIQNKRISIETLKIGKIFEMELKRQENHNNNTLSLTQSYSHGFHGPQPKKHERSRSLRINIQQNIFNGKTKVMKPLCDADEEHDQGMGNDDDQNGILCKVAKETHHTPRVTDSNSRLEPKQKGRKRSNSFTADSPKKGQKAPKNPFDFGDQNVSNQTIVFWD
eukprot:324716_1